MRAHLAILYVSTSKPASIVPLSNLCSCLKSSRGTHFAHTFSDVAYNRTSFYLVDTDPTNLATSACELFKSVVDSPLDFAKHTGTHPTLGILDHISFCPLRSTDIVTEEDRMEDLLETGKSAKQFISMISPYTTVYAYGYADEKVTSGNDEVPRLATIRKHLGYFEQSKSSTECTYDLDGLASQIRKDFNGEGGDVKPVDGSLVEMDRKTGMSCVGAVPFMMNFNIKFPPTDSLTDVRKVTKAVKRLEGVEALTLQHDAGYEVACNVKKPHLVGPESILSAGTEEANKLGLTVESSYSTGPNEQQLMDAFVENLQIC